MTQSAQLADYTLVAKNTSVDHVGSIHDDSAAQKFGYAGGLVPGVTLYGYMSHVLAQAWGPDWIRHGTIRSRSLRPAYEGQQVTVTCTDLTTSGGIITAEMVVTGAGQDKPLAIGTGTFGSPPEPPPLATVLPMPDPAPHAGIGEIPVGHCLGTTATELTDEDLDTYLEKIAEDYGYYHEHRVFPPSYLQQVTTRVERANFEYETPTIYVEGWTQHLGELKVGDVVSCPGTVTKVHERKGNHYMDVDMQVVANGRDVVAMVGRSSIYRARDSRS